jgi:hypothetical protein
MSATAQAAQQGVAYARRRVRTSSPLGERWVSGEGVVVALALSLFVSILLLYSLWAFWPTPVGNGELAPETSRVQLLGAEITVSSDAVLFVLVAIAGALGGMVHTLRSLAWYVGNRQLRWSWVPFYALRPVLGGALATLFYLVIRAGLFSPATNSDEVSPYGFAALAALVGLFSEQAVEKLKQISGTLFTEVKPGKDHFEGIPGVTTEPATRITAASGTLNGRLNPRGAETTYWFQYGETIEYGRSTPEELFPGTSLGHVSAVVDDLKPGTTYHFRLVAANDAGEAESADATLATPDG